MGTWARLALAASLLLTGCNGFWDAPATTTTGTTTDSSGVFYVLNQETSQVVAYDISSGTLTKIAAYTLPAASPYALAISPNGSFLYVSTASGIFLYDIGSGGALTIQNGGLTISSDAAQAMQVDPTGAWLVDAWIPVTSGPVQVDAIPLTSTGTYNSSEKVQSATMSPSGGISVHQLVVTPDDGNVIVALGTAGTVVVPFSAGSFGSSYSAIPLAHSGGAALSVAVDPINSSNSASRLFYIGESLGDASGASGGLRVFNYASLGTGTLTQVSGSPFESGGLAPNAILPLANGSYVYVANGKGNSTAGNVEFFTVAGTSTYTVTAGSSIAAGIQPIGLAEDNSGNFVMAVATGGSTSSGNPDFEAFTMSSGALTSVVTSTTGTDPVAAVAIAAVP